MSTTNNPEPDALAPEADDIEKWKCPGCGTLYTVTVTGVCGVCSRWLVPIAEETEGDKTGVDDDRSEG
jgi:hypothetical protein